MALLECKNLCVGYSSKTVCENLNFCIEKGDYFFIVGENGSGKSTLMKTVLKFIKPLFGEIIYSPEWNTKGLGYLPQTSEITKKMHQILKELNEQGLTIITISHDREAAEKYGTKILKLGENPELVETAK